VCVCVCVCSFVGAVCSVQMERRKGGRVKKRVNPITQAI
jgi:hypothetical protein